MAKRRANLDTHTLTLKLDGTEVTAERFIKSVSAFVSIIKDVTESLSGEKNGIKWIVSVEKGSALVHFTPKPVKVNPAMVQSAIRAVTNGFREIEENAGRPSYWSDSSLKNAKEISSVYTPAENALGTISVSGDGTSVAKVTNTTGANVDSIVGTERRAFGTVEGRLRAVTESGGIHVVVQDPITHANIRCFIEESDVDRFVAAFRKRVSVYGEIRYGRDGAPLSIKAAELRVMRDSTKLPTVKEVTGIYV
jgi:hypothetical protein